jgi:spoIIIJ-associated protein
MNSEENGESLTAEGTGASVGEAKWSAIKALEPSFPGIEAEDVEFEVLDAGDEADERAARVRARVDPARWEEGGGGAELPEEPAERVRALVGRVTQALGLRASVDVVETEEEIAATVNGEDLGLLIGKHGTTIDALQHHGTTIDALQHIAARVAFRGHGDRKTVTIDAAGYRERREAALQRAADQAVEDALSYGRAVELEPMSAAERRIVHTYLRDRTEIQTHSEGDEPDRRLVVTPVRASRD